MHKHILSNWTFSRMLYLVMGLLIIIQAVYENLYIGYVFGGYFIAMSLFNFGCAAGTCCSYNPNHAATNKITTEDKAVQFEDVNNKQV